MASDVKITVTDGSLPCVLEATSGDTVWTLDGGDLSEVLRQHVLGEIPKLPTDVLRSVPAELPRALFVPPPRTHEFTPPVRRAAPGWVSWPRSRVSSV